MTRGDRDVDTTGSRLVLVPLELARVALSTPAEEESLRDVWTARHRLRTLLGIEGETRPHYGGQEGSDTPREPVRWGNKSRNVI